MCEVLELTFDLRQGPQIITPRAHARARGYVIGRGVYIYIVYKSALFFGTNFLSPKILTFRGLL